MSLEDLVQEGDRRLKLEKDGMYDSNGDRILPFDEVFISRVLLLAVEMEHNDKLPDRFGVYTKISRIRQTFQQLLQTLHISRHSEAPSEYWIDKFRVDQNFQSWIAKIDEGDYGETVVAEVKKF